MTEPGAKPSWLSERAGFEPNTCHRAKPQVRPGFSVTLTAQKGAVFQTVA
jgi:hypothetical protein